MISKEIIKITEKYKTGVWVCGNEPTETFFGVLLEKANNGFFDTYKPILGIRKKHRDPTIPVLGLGKEVCVNTKCYKVASTPCTFKKGKFKPINLDDFTITNE